MKCFLLLLAIFLNSCVTNETRTLREIEQLKSDVKELQEFRKRVTKKIIDMNKKDTL